MTDRHFLVPLHPTDMRPTSVARPRSSTAVLLAGCTGLLLLGACTESGKPAATAESTGDAGGTLIIATPAEADGVLPPFAQSPLGRQVVDMTFDHLAEPGDDLNLVGDAGFRPRLAKSWTWGPDSLSLAFTLDERARWHDGRPVRASDVKFSVDVSRDSTIGSPVAEYLTIVDSVSVRDSLTPVVWFNKRSPKQFYNLVYNVWVMPQHVYGNTPAAQLRSSELARQPVGSGRFRFVRWDAGSRMELVSDTANYRGRAKLDRIIWTKSTDPNAAVAQVASGDADMMEIVPPALLPQLQGRPVKVVPYPGFQYAFMLLNSAAPGGRGAHPVLGEAAVRRALSMAVDREGMVRNVFDTLGKVARGPYPRAHPSADTSLAPLPYDSARAAQLLDSAGWRVGTGGVRQKAGRRLAFAILVPASSKARMDYAVLLQEGLRRAGADVRIESVDFPTFLDRLRNKRFDAALQAISIDPHMSGVRQYFSGAAAGVDGQNVASYRSAAFDAALDSADAAYDAASAKRHMRRAYEQMIQDAPAIWLYDVPQMMALHQRIHPTTFRADSWWSGLADWTIPAGERTPRDRIGVGTGAASSISGGVGTATPQQ